MNNVSYIYYVIKREDIMKTTKTGPIKESWNREEVATLIRRVFAGVEGKYTIEVPLKINKWINENL